jgi:hypothetical protein
MRSICRTNEEHSHIQYQTTKAMNMNYVSVTKSRIGSLHEISISFIHTWLESVFHADSHGIFFCLNEPKYA